MARSKKERATETRRRQERQAQAKKAQRTGGKPPVPAKKGGKS